MSELLDPVASRIRTEPPGTVTAPVCVLLATYNAGPFLAGQLRSIAAQTGADWRILWHDDGSSDGTLPALEAFARANPGRLAPLASPHRLGIAGSFHALLRAAPAGCVAFCDQDDVWLPTKLARAQTALGSVAEGTPALYCARQLLVDEALRPLGGSMQLARPPVFPMALTQNIATGCTIVLNAAAAALLRRSAPPSGTLHDWWSYLLVSAAGGQVIVDHEPAVLYRQHGGNAVGAPATQLRRAIAAVRRGPGVFMRAFRANLAGLLACPELVSPAALDVLREVDQGLRQGRWARARVLRRVMLRRQTTLETVLFCVWFLLG